MAVVSSNIVTWGGSRGVGEEREYTLVYFVETDDKDDGPQQVIDNYGGVDIGDKYSHLNDSDKKARCVSLKPDLVDAENDRKHWRVTATFRNRQSEENKQGTDKNGNPTDDPLQFARELNVGKVKRSEPVWTAELMTDLPRIGRRKGSLGAVVNAAGDILDPPLEKDVSDDVLRISSWARVYPQEHSDFVNSVNSHPVRIVINLPKFDKTYPSYTLKFQNLGGSKELVNDETLWRLTYELEANFKQDEGGKVIGWIDEVPNVGRHARAGHGDPDGFGGTIDYSQIADGVPPFRRILDPDGFPVTDPVPLDFAGIPIRAGDLPVFIKYLKYPKLDFVKLNISDA